MTFPLVSVVIPTYNRASMVGKAICSALDQTYRDIEVIVVDDGSTDNTAEVVAAFGDDRLRYVRLIDNRGHGAARNTGIDFASGDYVAFLDSDDEWLPRTLERQLEAMRAAGPDFGISVCGRRKIHPETGHERIVVPELRGEIHENTVRLEWVPATGTLMIRRDLLEDERFDENLRQLVDLDLMIRLTSRTKVTTVPELLLRMSDHEGARVTGSGAESVAWAFLAAKYSDALTQRPRILSRYHHRSFVTALRAGDLTMARSQLWKSLRLDPLHTRRWLWLASMAAGPTINAKLRQIRS